MNAETIEQQLDLGSYPVTSEVNGHVGPHPEPRIEQAFWRFHRDNPHVYTELVAMARQVRKVGHQRVGIGMLFEVLRWRRLLRTANDDFKLNNNYRSYYSRLIMTQEPDLEGIFQTRKLHDG